MSNHENDVKSKKQKIRGNELDSVGQVEDHDEPMKLQESGNDLLEGHQNSETNLKKDNSCRPAISSKEEVAQKST